MMHRPFLLRPFVALALAATLGLGAARATDYSEIRQLLREGKLTEAQSRVDRQLASQPKDVQLRLFKGVIQRELGRPNEALGTFSRLSDDHPELPEPYNNMAAIHAAQGQLDKARIALEKALRTHPSYATAHDNLSEVYARLASQAYSKALQLDGSPPAEPARLALIRDLPGPPGTPSRTLLASAPTQTAPAKPAAPAPTAAAPSVPAPASKPTLAASAPPAVKAPVAAPPPTRGNGSGGRSARSRRVPRGRAGGTGLGQGLVRSQYGPVPRSLRCSL
jgi:hypothetical protein